MYKHFPFQGPPKFTQIGIFGLKINPLATLTQLQNDFQSNSICWADTFGDTFEKCLLQIDIYSEINLSVILHKGLG
jgi:hypothetical protein